MSNIRTWMTASNMLFESMDPLESQEPAQEKTYSAYNLTDSQMRDAVEKFEETGELTHELELALVNHYNDVMPTSVQKGRTETPDQWLCDRGYDAEAIEEIKHELAGIDGPDDQSVEDAANRETLNQQHQRHWNEKHGMREADEDNLDGLENDDDMDLNKEFDNMGRFDNGDRSDNYELGPVGSHDAPEETDVDNLLLDIQDYQDRGMSAAAKSFNVNDLRDMPYQVVKKIHNLVVGSDDDDASDVDHEIDAHSEEIPEDASSNPAATSAPPTKSHEEMINDIHDHQQLGVSNAPAMYDVQKLANCHPKLLAQIHTTVTSPANNGTDVQVMQPANDPEGDYHSVPMPEQRAMEAIARLTDAQLAEYKDHIRTPALRKALSESIEQRAGLKESADVDLKNLRRLAGLK